MTRDTKGLNKIVKLDNMFEVSKDTETHRVCGTCGKPKPFKEFYKDGKDSSGNMRYRRDCKECYKNTRIIEAKMKGGKQNGIPHKSQVSPLRVHA